MTELIGDFFGHLFKVLGAALRWAFGKLKWSNGKSLTFKEYLYGPNPDHSFADEDETTNALIGGIVFFTLVLALLILFIL